MSELKLNKRHSCPRAQWSASSTHPSSVNIFTWFSELKLNKRHSCLRAQWSACATHNAMIQDWILLVSIFNLFEWIKTEYETQLSKGTMVSELYSKCNGTRSNPSSVTIFTWFSELKTNKRHSCLRAQLSASSTHNEMIKDRILLTS